MLGLIGVSIVVFVWMDPYYFMWRKEAPPAPPSKPGAAAKPGAPAAAAAPAQSGAAATPAQPAAPVIPPTQARRNTRPPVEFTDWARDPFIQARRFVDDQSQASGFKLEGVSVRGKDRYALINTQILRVGDTIGAMSVIKIEKDRVTLSRNGRDFVLTMGP